MIHKTPALVLRVTPFSETSQIVTWLTPTHGKLATIIKGALRRNSGFVGHYDLFYLCELLFYERHQTDLHIAGECSILKARQTLRHDWKATACASYLAGLIDAWLPPNLSWSNCFHLLDSAFDALAAAAPATLVPWCELQLLNMAGLAPDLKTCRKCRRLTKTNDVSSNAIISAAPSSAADNTWFFVPQDGGLICAGCQKKYALTPLPPQVTPDIINILRFWQDHSNWEVARRMRCNRHQWQRLMELLGIFIAHHLEVSDRARRVMLELTA